MLALAALGVFGLLAASKSAKAATPGGGGGPTAPVRPELQNVPLPLLQEMATALQLLTVDPNGNIVGPVTEDAIRNATALAAKLEAAGFPEAAKTIRDFALLAAKKVPTPSKERQIPLPAECFTPAEQQQITRLATLERDPRVIRGVVNGLRSRAIPQECRGQVEAAITMLEAIAVQMEARLAEEEALRKIEEELRRKGQTPVSPGIPQPGPVTPPFVPSPVPPSPGTPPPPPGSNPRVVVVQSDDGFIRIMRRLLGPSEPESRWRELRDRNVPLSADGRRSVKATDAKGGIAPALKPGQKLFVPEQWPAMPGIPVPGPVTPVPGPVGPVPGTGVRITIVQAGDGFSRIAQRLGNTSLMTRLRDANVPQSADGKRRTKADMATKGGILPILQPGDRLFVPPEFPQSTFAVIQGVPLIGIGLADEEILMEKSPVEQYAEEVVTHLNRLQAKHPLGFNKIHSKMDKRKIARFEKAAGLNVTATISPTLLLRAAELGQSKLPLVMDWPEGATVEHVIGYRNVLLQLAEHAKATGNEEAAYELMESLKREKGQSAGISFSNEGE